MNSFSIEYHNTKLWMNPVAYRGRSRLVTAPATSALVMDQACGGQLKHGMVLVERLTVAARRAAHVGDPAARDDLLRLVPDILGDQPRLLVVQQCVVVALGFSADGADIVEHVGLMGQVADVTEGGQGALVGGQRLLVAALVVVDPADVEVQDRLVLPPLYLGEYPQR